MKEILFTPFQTIEKKLNVQYEETSFQSSQKEYQQIASQLLSLSEVNDTVKRQMAEIYKEIIQVSNESYQNKNLQKIISSLNSQDLGLFAVQSFIGSMTFPRSDTVMQQLLQHADNNAKNEEDKLLIQYYRVYLSKLSALQTGDKKLFEKSNEELIDLCNQNFPIAMHLLGKELYKVAINIKQQKEKKQKKELIKKAYELLSSAVQNGQISSLYYLGEMAESGDLPGSIDLSYAYECFLMAATKDSAKAFFKLAQYHKEGTVTEKNQELEFFYTKKAAELGLLEAQHNLACMYLEKKITKYNSLKALAWYNHSSAQGFQQSMYNVAQMFMMGSEDNQVKVNYDAALVYLTKLQKLGEINVSKLIDYCQDQLAQILHDKKDKEDISQQQSQQEQSQQQSQQEQSQQKQQQPQHQIEPKGTQNI